MLPSTGMEPMTCSAAGGADGDAHPARQGALAEPGEALDDLGRAVLVRPGGAVLAGPGRPVLAGLCLAVPVHRASGVRIRRLPRRRGSLGGSRRAAVYRAPVRVETHGDLAI